MSACADVLIYTHRLVPLLRRARRRSSSKKEVAFTEIDVDDRAGSARAGCVSASGQRTVPQVFINGRAGGRLHRPRRRSTEKGELDALLAEAPAAGRCRPCPRREARHRGRQVRRDDPRPAPAGGETLGSRAPRPRRAFFGSVRKELRARPSVAARTPMTTRPEPVSSAATTLGACGRRRSWASGSTSTRSSASSAAAAWAPSTRR